MSNIGNKEIFSKNLRQLMERFGKDRTQVCADLGFKYTTFADWYNGVKYPRIDRIEMLANYFGVLKSDLIEDKGGVFSIDGSTELSKSEQYILDVYRSVSKEGREYLLQQATVASQIYKNNDVVSRVENTAT